VEFTSNYCTLRIIPISDETVRVLVSKGNIDRIRALPEELGTPKEVKWNFRDTREQYEILLKKLTIRIPKKTGALEFFSSKGAPLLAENATLCRQYHGSLDVWWEYFSWGKKESLTARGESDDIWKSMEQTARYISHKTIPGRASLISSSKGYQLLVPSGIKTLVCTIPSYGPYLCFEDSELVDYIFRTSI